MKLALIISSCSHRVSVSLWGVPVAPPHVVMKTEGRVTMNFTMGVTVIPGRMAEPNYLWAKVVVILILGLMTSYRYAQFVIVGLMTS